MSSLKGAITVLIILGSLTVPASASASIASDPTSYDFGTWNSANDVIPLTHFVVTSTDPGELMIEDATVTGASADAFHVRNPEECLPPGHPDAPACVVEVSFNYHGTTGGQKAAVLSIDTNQTEEPLSVPLSGRVEHTRLSVSPESHDFGRVPSGSSNASTKTFTITSEGSIPFVPGRPWISDFDPFAPPVLRTEAFGLVSHDCDVVISPGESCTATVAFKPAAWAQGKQSGRLAIGAGMIPTSAVLKGEATAPEPSGPADPNVVVRLKFPKRPQSGRHSVLAVHLRNDGPAVTDSFRVAVKSSSKFVLAPKGIRIPPLGEGERFVKRVRFKVRSSVKPGQTLRFTAAARLAGIKFAGAKKTVRVR